MADTVQQNVEQFAPLKKMIAANGDILAVNQEGGDSNLSGLVDTFLAYTEKNGIPEGFTWADVKAIIVAKFEEVTKKYEAERPVASLPEVPNVDNYTFSEYHTRILEHLNRFEDSPFTLGRMCELLRDPRKHYDRGDKFLRAFEKCVTVTSTNGDSETTTNGVHSNGHTTGEATNGNGYAKNGDEPMETDAPAVNGSTVDSSVTGTDSSAAAEATEPIAEAIQETTVGASVADGEKETVDSSVTAPGDDKASQKRPNEDSEHDAVAKKLARIENGGEGVTHAVVGEPEVEPQPEVESKKVVDVDTTAAVETTDETAAPVVEKEAAVV